MKRFAFVLFIGALAWVSCQKDRELIEEESPLAPLTRSTYPASGDNTSHISKEDALKIVEPITSEYSDRWVDISDEIIPAGTTIAFNTMGHQLDIEDYSFFLSPEYDSWLLVIENDVAITGSHRHIHIFVNAVSGEYSTIELEGRAIIKWDTARNICIHPDNNSEFDRKNNQRLPERSNGTTQWAVIISGGCDSLQNYSRYYNDCVNIYSKLTQVLDYPKGNIFCLVADGTDPALDQKIGPNTYISSNPDLDNDGTNDIQYEANRTNIASVFNNLSLLVSPGDEVLVFMTDHGSPYGYFCLWGSETLSPYQLNVELNKLGSSVMIDVVIESCYSGAFVSQISASNRTIATACSSTEVSYGLGYQYNYFIHYWTEYISFAAANGDSYVTPSELFRTAFESVVSTLPQVPQYSSSPSNFGVTHSLIGEIIPVITGSNYLSTNMNSLYSIVNYPNPTSVSWTVGNNLSLVSYTDSTAIVKGNITSPGIFCESAALVSADIVVEGKTHQLTKVIDSVWKPGIYNDGNHIWGSNGTYQVRHFGGEYGYVWQSDNSAWPVISFNEYTATVSEGYTNNPVNLIVVFNDPLGEIIVVKDRVH